MTPHVLGIALIATSFAANPAWADSIDTSGQALWERCGYCHGIDGVSGNPRFPHLAGQREDYLRKQLRDFRDGRRRNDDGIMATQAEGLDSATIEQLVAHFASQTPAVTTAPVSATGGTLYDQGDQGRGIPPCRSCHGSQEQVAKLAGQHAEYLAKQLDDFARKRRTNAPEETMDVIAGKLTAGERQQIAAFLAGMGCENH
ncbi:c-type cytochrome [Marinobacteraceae bacterium S3BR75-40.1]